MQISLVPLTILVLAIWGHKCDVSPSCGQCSSSLVELLEQVDLDLKYANKTIDKSRANAKFGLRLEQAESAYSEHASGLNKSEAMYQQATRTITNFAASRDISSTIDDLENKVKQSFARLPSRHSEYHDHVKQLNSAAGTLKSNLEIQLQRINSSRENLDQIDKNYLNQCNPKNRGNSSEDRPQTLELGSGVIKKMVRESRALIRVQENSCDRLDSTLEELTLLLRRVTMSKGYIATMRDSSELCNVILSSVLNLTQPLSVDDLNDMDLELQSSIKLARNVSESFSKLNRTLGIRASGLSSENLDRYMGIISFKTSQIQKNLKAGSNQIPEFSRFQNGTETNELLKKLSYIKTHVSSLDDQISKRVLDLKSAIAQHYLDEAMKTAIDEYENLTRSDSWQGFFGLDGTIDLVHSNVNYTIEVQAKIDQLHRLENFSLANCIEEVVFSQLMPNVTRIRQSIIRFEAEMTKEKSNIAKLNETITNDIRQLGRSSLLEEMRNLTLRTNTSAISVYESVEKAHKMIDEFSEETRNLYKVNGSEIFEYLHSSEKKPSEEPQIFTLANWLLNDANRTLSIQVNRNLTVEMQQVAVKLRNKVNHARSLINHFCQMPDYGRMVSFPRPKSNISSSYVQSLNLNHELDELMLEHSGQEESLGSFNQTNGHIKRLTIKFRSLQQNGLLVHHSRPDHSSFMSIYITGGRLMLAINFDKKIRIESHISLSDGQWHTLYLIVSRRTNHHQQNKQQGSPQSSASGCNRVKHSICAILDDSFTYKSRFTVCSEPITPRIMAATDRRKLSKRSADSDKEAPDVTAAQTNSQTNLAERLLNHADDDSSWEEQSKKILYFGGVEDKYIPLLRNQQIPTNFHGCIADVSINNIKLNFLQTRKNQAVVVNHCQPDY